MKTFIQCCIEGSAEPEEIDNYIDIWHEMDSDIDIELCEFLGMTKDEYAAFVKNPEYINTIILDQIRV